mmetsp:Transcript_10149/g.42578  ORF Transcript_10149/g.42578 Transcript_10149/m.42578 type:complete len:314 (-) Transcript_10149:881-1822(-)
MGTRRLSRVATTLASGVEATSKRSLSMMDLARTSSSSVPLQYLKFSAKEEKGESEFPPVIVLHGLMASSGTYKSLLRRSDFAPKRDVYALDLRNHGSSPHHENTNYQSLVSDVKHFMDENGLEQACLIGHSLGGKIAMIMALEAEERVSELVVIDIAPQFYQAPPEEDRPTIVALRAMAKTNPVAYQSREDVQNALQQFGVDSQRLRNFLMTNLVPDPKNPGHFRWRVNIRAIAEGLPDLLSFPEYDQSQKFVGKSLFIRGMLSENVTNQHQLEIRRLFPTARIVSVDNAGHWVQADAPETFVSAVNKFLGDV